MEIPGFFFMWSLLEVEAEAVTGLRLSTHMALRQTPKEKIQTQGKNDLLLHSGSHLAGFRRAGAWMILLGQSSGKHHQCRHHQGYRDGQSRRSPKAENPGRLSPQGREGYGRSWSQEGRPQNRRRGAS